MRAGGSLRVSWGLALCLVILFRVLPVCGAEEGGGDFTAGIGFLSNNPINEGKQVRLQGVVSGAPEGASLTWEWSVPEGMPSVSFEPDAVSQTVAFAAPDVGPDGLDFIVDLTVTATSGDIFLEATAQKTVTVSWVNDGPVANAGRDQAVFEGVTVTLDGSGSSDPDGQDLVFSWTQSAGETVSLKNADTATPSFIAPNVGPGASISLTFRLTVTDGGGLTSSDTCVIRVNSANGPPVADAGGDRTVEEGESVVLDGTGSRDPDGDPLTWLWTQEDGLSVELSDSAVSEPAFQAPNVDSNGTTLIFLLVVEDEEGLSDQDRCLITVLGDNELPQVDAGITQEVDEGERVILDGSGCHDPEGKELKYLWVQTDGVGVELETPDMETASFTAPEVGPAGAYLAFDLFVEDSGGLKARDHCFVDVRDTDGQGGPAVSSDGGGCESGPSISIVMNLMLLNGAWVLHGYFRRR